MQQAMPSRRHVAGVCLAVVLGSAASGAGAQASASGVLTEGCAVHWQAKSAHGTQDTSTLGFNQNVLPSNGDPGYMQVQHFYLGNPDRMVWRPVIATTYPILGAAATLTLTEAGGPWAYDNTQDPAFFNARPVFYAPASYAGNFAAPTAAPTTNADGSLAFSLGTLAANSGVAFRVQAPVSASLGTNGPYLATLVLTGNYIRGNPGEPNTSPTCVYASSAAGDVMSMGPSGGTTQTVLANDTSNGQPASTTGAAANAVLTPGAAPVAGMSMNADGTVTVAANTPPGTYAYSYRICPKADPAPAQEPAASTCSTAEAQVRVMAPPAPAPVPTLGAWTLMLLGALLAGLGIRQHRCG